MNEITANHISASKAISDLTSSTSDLRIPQILANHLPENSMKPIYKLLILNLLEVLGDHYGNAGCNDIDKNSPELKGINFEELEKEYQTIFANKIAKDEYPAKLNFNGFLIELAQKAIQNT